VGLISEKCFAREWFEQKQRERGQLSPQLLETVTYALELLAELVKRGLPLVFKGGTSILLLIDDIRRLSIDIDVAMPVSRDEVLPVLEAIATESRFLDVQPLDRDPHRLPKRHHYLFHYPSVYTQQPGSLQLDILEDDAHYPDIVERPIVHSLVEVEEDIAVRLPTIDGLLGDKLTAFAPTTIGIRYGSYKDAIRIVKQVCDIGELLNHASDLTAVKAAHARFLVAESSYVDEPYATDAIAADRIAAAELLSLLHTKWHPADDEHAATLEAGVRQIDSHIVGHRYSFDNAKVAAAKAAALTAMFSLEGTPPPISDVRYSEEKIAGLRTSKLAAPYDKLNILLRAGNAEAFYYWLLAEKYGKG
jgi:hypothetical protein